MKRELDYFRIADCYGGCQDWFLDPMMKGGGCAAVTACDTCIYTDLYRPELVRGDTGFYPYGKEHLTKRDYIRFSKVMKPYLRPRMSGIDRLELYMEGLGAYLSDRGLDTLEMEGFSGEEEEAKAREKVREQIDGGFPIPCLLLKHKNPKLKEYVWHWFLLTGYEALEETFLVKAVTYGEWEWLDLGELWNTGEERKGGLVLYRARLHN